MTSRRPIIVLSGLPASGKTTLAMRIAPILALPLIDKDHILEALFTSEEKVIVPATRQRLSRASDVVMQAIAAASQGAVLVSFWRHPDVSTRSGTPTDWIAGLSETVVEVHCICEPDLAARRFAERERHPGHNDKTRGKPLSAQFEQLAELGPLGIGSLIEVRTDRAYDLDALVDRIQQQMSCMT